MRKIVPPKLRPGDTICIIAPSKSLATLTKEQIDAAEKRLTEIGLQVSYGKHVEEINDFHSSSVDSRIVDLHEAFADSKINGILAAAGGYNSNQLLRHIDWQLIQNNPKIFCGYSDITTLLTAFYTKTGLITYSGPNFTSFCDPLEYQYMLQYFKKCLMETDPFQINPSKEWSNNILSDDKTVHINEGFWAMQEGECEGIALGENLITLDLLKGTEYFPRIENSILFLEDDFYKLPENIDEHLEALIIDKRFKHVRGIVFGRFQEQSKMTRQILKEILDSKSELQGMPILGNVDFGHTEPKFTFPFGGRVKIQAATHANSIQFIEH
jgi:muramoyltetrapeptide carboxypeptidase LdcA involved in peptidoglycan recycling